MMGCALNHRSVVCNGDKVKKLLYIQKTKQALGGTGETYWTLETNIIAIHDLYRVFDQVGCARLTTLIAELIEH